MSKWLVSLAILFIGVLAFWRFFPHSRDMEPYQHLRMPQTFSKPAQKMIAIQLQGEPDKITRQAGLALVQTYYALKVKTPAMKLEPIRARWVSLPSNPHQEWTGVFGLPVPPNISKLPRAIKKALPKMRLVAWEYGTVAEILHTGSYAEEGPTLEKLNQFIEAQGWRIIGPQEEEYVVGRGFFNRGNPKKYQTIIRFRVEKKAEPASNTPASR